jgi:hypothetical protein
MAYGYDPMSAFPEDTITSLRVDDEIFLPLTSND